MFDFTLITPDGVVVEKQLAGLDVVTTEGEMGVRSHHMDTVVALSPGTLLLVDAKGTSEKIAVAGGILEIRDGKATVIAT